jgi:Flp pilus assembly protein TadD
VPVYAEDASAALARNLRVLGASPKDFNALIAAGRASLELGDTQAAAGFFGRAEEVWPQSPLPQAGMGSAMVAMGDARGAMNYFHNAQRLGASHASIAVDRGLAFDLMGDQAKAQSDYRAALSGPDANEARRRLALSLAISRDQRGASETLAPLLQRRDPLAVRTNAFVLALAGDREAAKRTIDAALPGAGARFDPFFQVLPVLRPDEKAAAVHLGEFPKDAAQRYAQAAPVSSSPVVTIGRRTIVDVPRSTNRLGDIENMLRAPAAPAASSPSRTSSVRMASVTPPSRETVAEPTGKRVWLQLASGPNVEALPDQFRKIKARSDDLLDGINGYIAEGPDRARLLIGPFKSVSDATIFAEDLETVRIGAFSWTSPPGQTIRKLPPQ